MRLPLKDSATWRAIITAIQAFIALLAVLLALPEFRQLVLQFYPEFLPYIVTASGAASFLFNFFRPSVKNY